MSFFAAMLADADTNPFEEIPKFLSPGTYSLPTGNHSVEKSGATIEYGPTVNFQLSVSPNEVEIVFAAPRPKARVMCNIAAVIYALEFTPDGTAYARGSLGPAAFRKKITVTDA